MTNTLYISDLDGTLLNKNSEVPEYSQKALNSLIDKGLNFTIATARSWNSASKKVKNINVTLPAITYNGAFVVDSNTGDIIQSNCMEKDYAEYALNEFIKRNIHPHVYAFIDGTEKVSFINDNTTEGFEHYLSQRKNDKRFNPVSSTKELLKGDIFYITAIDKKENLKELNTTFNEKDYFSINFQQELYRPEYWLEIKRFDSNKGAAAEKIKEIIGCKKIISFGDNINDIPLFLSSDEGYAVSNGAKELIEKSNGVIDISDKNGVAKWLEEKHAK